MVKRQLLAVGCGLIGAALYLPIAVGVPGGVFSAYLASVPLFLAGLALGRREAVTAAAAGTIAVALLGTGWVTATAFGLSQALPALVTVRRAVLSRVGEDGGTEWYPVGRSLVTLAGIAAIGLVTAELFAAGEPGGLEGISRSLVSTLARRLAEDGVQLDPGLADSWIPTIIPGTTGASWLLMMVINGVFAQWIAVRLGSAVRATPEWSRTTPPPFTAEVFLALVALALLPDPIGFTALNLVVILSAAFALTGLARVHRFARGAKGGRAILIGVYTVLVLFGWPVLLLIGLGLIDQLTASRRPKLGDRSSGR